MVCPRSPLVFARLIIFSSQLLTGVGPKGGSDPGAVA
jgi:hypothetical protein